MDLGNETELDYEEELEFSGDENTQGTFLGEGNKKLNEGSSCFNDDQYLQIDYLEEDENLPCSNVPSGIASRNINPSETELSLGVLCEGKKIINQRKNTFTSKYKRNRGNYTVPHNLKSKPLSDFRQPFHKKKNTTRVFTIDGLSNSTLLSNMPTSFATPMRRRQNDQNSFHFLSSPRVEQYQGGALSVLNKKFHQLQPFSSSSFDFSENQQDFVRNVNAQLLTSVSNTSLKSSSSSNNRLRLNSVIGNIDYNLNSDVTKSQGDNIRLPMDAKKDVIDNSNCCKLKQYKKIDFSKEIDSSKGSNSSLKDSEKELVRLKRIARLIRFGNENSFQRSKSEGKTYHESLYFEDEYFRKMEEQKNKRQKIFELKEKQRHVHNPEDVGDNLMKFNTGEDRLLKKINPFYVKSGMIHNLDTKIKQEVKYSDQRETVNLNLKEGLHIVKCDFDSNVKFTRTISKTYEEMNLSRCSGKETIITEATSTSVQAKEEIQNSGCIVKVLNIPQVTMSDVLALCSPVGKPLEVKLNTVKENAVIIKFSNPIFAANFYGLYHGIKVNSDFLNVIII